MRNLFLSLALLTAGAFSYAQEGDFNPQKGDLLVRVRALGVIPSEDDNTNLGDVAIGKALVPELDFTYFFTENLAAELILGTTNHSVDLETATGDVDLGNVNLLPPTLTLQYHLPLNNGKIKPYAGAGINYTIFYGVDSGVFKDISYDNKVGFALQLGSDFYINDKMFINADVKKIFLKTDVTIDTGAGTLPVEVNIDPWLLGVGMGMKF